MKRAMGLYLPFLATDRRRRVDTLDEDRWSARPTPQNNGGSTPRTRHASPVVTIVPKANVLRVVHVDQAARRSGIRPGQTLADARAVVPELVTFDDDPVGDRKQLESLAVWAGALSPVVQIEDDSTLLLDATGCERLFRGEGNLLRRAIEGLDQLGFTARAAIADTPGAVWALSHAHPESSFLSEPGRGVADLASLPVGSLRIDAKTTASLGLVGVETIGSLLYLPRSSLAARFGDGILDRIDQALGELPEPLTPYRPEPVVTSRCHFGAPTDRLDLLHEGVRRTLRRFCDDLTKRVGGVRELMMTFHGVDEAAPPDQRNRTVTIPINLSRPTRSVGHLESLLLTALDTLRLPVPADSLTLWSRHIDPLDDWQDELFVTDARDAEAIGGLVDRLSVRLGCEAVGRPEPISEHQPERAYRYGAIATHNNGPRGEPNAKLDPHRPLRLARRPIPIAATAIVPEGPPIAFRAEGDQHAVEISVGPERIETGWWRGPHLRRDYYRVVTNDGRRFWMFRQRETGRWFLHGWFD